MIKITPINFAIHQEEESPIFGEDTIQVIVNDDGGGPFYTITNINPSETDEDKIGFGKVSLSLEEIATIYKLAQSNEVKEGIKMGKIVVEVMADYCADGLWLDGQAIDADILAEEFKIDDARIGPVKLLAEDWQKKFEDLNLFNKSDAIYETAEFIDFIEQGKELAYMVRELLPQEIEVNFFQEYPTARFRVNLDNTMTLKEKYD